MDYKLIVCDMDGTLLTEDKKISDKNREVLKKAEEKGVRLAVATGRIYSSAKIYGEELGLQTPIISCNGALVRDSKTEETLFEAFIGEKEAEFVMDVCEKHNIYYHFYSDYEFFTKELKYTSLNYQEWNEKQPEGKKIDIQIIEKPKEVLDRGSKIYKFVILEDDQEKLNRVKLDLSKNEALELSQSCENNIEVMTKGVSKGVALEELCKKLGISREQVIAFGDHYNDISMIEYAGMGVAMGNGVDQLKERADKVTSANYEDGVALALEEILNI